jgi:hypothetical protein
MQFQIIGPPNTNTRRESSDSTDPGRLAKVKSQAAQALHHLDSLIAAADARRATGSWDPDSNGAVVRPKLAGDLAYAARTVTGRTRNAEGILNPRFGEGLR